MGDTGIQHIGEGRRSRQLVDDQGSSVLPELDQLAESMGKNHKHFNVKLTAEERHYQISKRFQYELQLK